MTIKDIRPPEDVPRLLADVVGGGGPGSPAARTWRHQRKDGTLIDVEITAGRIDFEGRRAALVVSHDVSERKRLERRLADAEKMEAIGRLAGGVAHDFNNLLTVIAGYAEILLARDRDSEEVTEISRAAGQAASLTRQLLAFSRRQVLHPKVVDLNEIVAGMETMLHRIIGDDVSVGIRLATDLSPVEADRAQIERVILNLAANARDAMPSGGALTIETANVEVDAEQVASHGDDGITGPHVLLAVSDTGHGMDEEVRQAPVRAVLHHQGRRDRHRTRPRDGVRRRQAERRRDLRLQRARPRHDVQDLPAGRRAPRRTRASRRSSPTPEGGTETIMVVEDDDGVRDLVRLMLESNGYEVLTVRDADEAARVCTERPCGVDLLLTDVMMPEVNGRVLAERLGALAPSMRILFMSGYSDEAVHRHGVLGDERRVPREAVHRAHARAQGARGPRRYIKGLALYLRPRVIRVRQRGDERLERGRRTRRRWGDRPARDRDRRVERRVGEQRAGGVAAGAPRRARAPVSRVERRGEAEDVGRRADPAVGRALLGRHEGVGADRRAQLRRLRERARDAEVDQPRRRAHHDVARLDVEVDDALGGHVVQRRGDVEARAAGAARARACRGRAAVRRASGPRGARARRCGKRPSSTAPKPRTTTGWASAASSSASRCKVAQRGGLGRA